MSAWYYVSLRHATFALVVEGGVVRQAPPIAAWTHGKRRETILAYYRRKVARIEERS